MYISLSTRIPPVLLIVQIRFKLEVENEDQFSSIILCTSSAFRQGIINIYNLYRFTQYIQRIGSGLLKIYIQKVQVFSIYSHNRFRLTQYIYTIGLGLLKICTQQVQVYPIHTNNRFRFIQYIHTIGSSLLNIITQQVQVYSIYTHNRFLFFSPLSPSKKNIIF